MDKKEWAVYLNGYGFIGKPFDNYDGAEAHLKRKLGKEWTDGAIYEKIATAQTPLPAIEITKL